MIASSRIRLAQLWRGALAKYEGWQWRTGLVYGLWTALWFLAFLLATFPHERLLEEILADKTGGRARLELDRVSFELPFGYSVQRALLRLPDAGDVAALEATDLSIEPSLLALIRLRLTPVVLRASFAGGRIDGRLEIAPNRIASRFAVQDVDLARWRGSALWLRGRLSGSLDGRLELDATLPGVTRNSGSLELELTGASVTDGSLPAAQGLKIPDLHFDKIVLEGTIANGRVQIVKALATGKELTASAQGVLTLASPLALSALNIDLKLTPSARPPADLALLLGLLPAPPASAPTAARSLRIFGTIARPRAAAG